MSISRFLVIIISAALAVIAGAQPEYGASPPTNRPETWEAASSAPVGLVFDEALSRPVTITNQTGSTPDFSEVISRGFTLTNESGSIPVFREAISRAFTITNHAGSVPAFDEAISRAFTVCNAAGAAQGECGEDCDLDGIPDPDDVCPCVSAPMGVDTQGRPLGDLDGDCDVDLNDFAVMQGNFTGPL